MNDETQNTGSAPASVVSNAGNEAKAVEHNPKLMGVLSYMGPLVLIPYLIAREDSFVKFHIRQGLVLFIISLLVWFATMILPFLVIIWATINFGVLILAVIGILNVFRGREKEIPFVGQYADKLDI